MILITSTGLGQGTDQIPPDDPFTRADHVRQLRNSQDAEATTVLLDSLRDPSPVVRAAAAGALTGHRKPGVSEALTDLLSDTNDHVRAHAVWSLAAVGGSTALPAVADRARHDTASIVRFRAVWGLAHIKDPAGLPVAIEALGDLNLSVRERSAVNAIKVLADSSVSQRLAPLASHPQPATRRLVMYLYSLYPSQLGDRLVRKATQDADPTVRGEAVLTAGKLRDGEALPVILPLLADSDEHVRGSAAYAIGLIGDTTVTDQLRPLLDDEAAFVRAIAAESLQRLGDKSVAPPDGFRAAELFTFPLLSPVVMNPSKLN